MTILPDGRWRLSGPEIDNKIWTKIKGWRLEADGRHMVPNFPECAARKLVAICLPCGKNSSLNYKCSKHDMYISVSFCTKCAEDGGSIAQEPTSAPATPSEVTTNSN